MNVILRNIRTQARIDQRECERVGVCIEDQIERPLALGKDRPRLVIEAPISSKPEKTVEKF